MIKNCGECAKLRTTSCTRPDHCVRQGYNDFSKSKPWKKCSECGGQMRRVRTDPNQSETVVKTEVVCVDCGWYGDDVREWIPRGFKKAPAMG
jgi:hypothetical protein